MDLPIVKEDKAVIGVGGAPIFAASEHQDAAWEFAKFLSSKDFQDTFIVEDGWSIPAVKSEGRNGSGSTGIWRYRICFAP